MSGPLTISLETAISFIESLLGPSFFTKPTIKKQKKRQEWLRTTAQRKQWDPIIADELIEIYCWISKWNQAMKEKDKLERLLAQQRAPGELSIGVRATIPLLQTVEFHREITSILPKGLSPNRCPNLIGADEAVAWAFSRIMRDIDLESDATYRKNPVVIARCPRGGKTTVLELLHVHLRQQGISAIMLSFNGTSGFRLLPNETQSEATFRMITNQLDSNIGAEAPRIVDWPALSAHIGDNRFVLLIDELNVLCPTVGAELAAVLKKYFLDKAKRHLVITSHQPFLTERKIDGTASADPAAARLWSDRSLTIVPMPMCNDVARLRQMSHQHCSHVTHALAAYYGYVPSLIYAVCRQSEESPAAKFNRVVPGTSDDSEQLVDFVLCLLTGIPHASLQKFYCFCSDVRVDILGIRVKWPLCYVASIFRYFAGDETAGYIARSIEVLAEKCETVGDGMVWEQCVRISLLLRLIISAKRRSWAPPLDLCSADEAYGAEVTVRALGPKVKTVADVERVVFENSAQFALNTVVLYVPAEVSLNQFDGFCVRHENYAVRQASGYQCRAQYNDDSKGAKGAVPAWINKGGHLFRSEAPDKCKNGGRCKEGWTYYDWRATDTFLGWSLQVMRV